MIDAMTVEEAVAVAEWLEGLTVYSDNAAIMPAAMSYQKASDVLERVRPALAAFKAHAERTVEARSGEPQRVAEIRAHFSDPHEDAEARDVRTLLSHIDHLTARLAEVEAERDARITDIKRIIAPIEVGGGVEAFLTDRDTLAGIVERVRALCAGIASAVDADCLCGECDDESCIAASDVHWVRVDDILAALTPTREGA